MEATPPFIHSDRSQVDRDLNKTETTIKDLHIELIPLILLNLSNQDAVKASLVCKQWQFILNDKVNFFKDKYPIYKRSLSSIDRIIQFKLIKSDQEYALNMKEKIEKLICSDNSKSLEELKKHLKELTIVEKYIVKTFKVHEKDERNSEKKLGKQNKNNNNFCKLQ